MYTLRLRDGESFNEDQNVSKRLSTVSITLNEDSSHFVADVNFNTGKLGISLKHTKFIYYTVGTATVLGRTVLEEFSWEMHVSPRPGIYCQGNIVLINISHQGTLGSDEEQLRVS